jgi:hypothetical protein
MESDLKIREVIREYNGKTWVRNGTVTGIFDKEERARACAEALIERSKSLVGQYQEIAITISGAQLNIEIRLIPQKAE